jgi:GMP synthase-like glutamine amidotransferase
MILLVDLCYRPGSLSRDEFVGPVARIVGQAGYAWTEMHFSEIRHEELERAAGIILCGTALEDNLFATQEEKFAWLRDVRVPVLGICAGMQVISLLFGGRIRPGCGIGMTMVRAGAPAPILTEGPEFMAYELHTNTCDPPPGWVTMAVSDNGIQAVRHPDRPLYGVMFHPEVRNDAVVERFLAACRKRES